MEYADCYRAGAVEGEIYGEVGKRFAMTGEAHGIAGFGASAYLHHLGGPTSPLGNRDYIIEPEGRRRMFPMMQFAVNPVEAAHGLKVEVQGIVTGEGPPRMLDSSIYTPPSLMTCSTITAAGGTRGKVADLIVRD